MFEALRPSLSSRRLRLASGLGLFAYILTHLINHVLGLVSLELAEAGLRVAMLVWQSLPGTLVLYGAACLHFSLALRTIYLRHDWRIPLIEIVRLWAGFSLPLLLIGHFATTRLSHELQGATPSYAGTVAQIVAGGSQQWQIALLAPGWLHGCLGLWLTLRRSKRMRRAKPLLIAFVIALPLASAAGFGRMGREVKARGFVAAARSPTPSAVQSRGELLSIANAMTNAYLALIAGAILLGPIRRGVRRRFA